MGYRHNSECGKRINRRKTGGKKMSFYENSISRMLQDATEEQLRNNWFFIRGYLR